jgi:hypothetical protein
MFIKFTLTAALVISGSCFAANAEKIAVITDKDSTAVHSPPNSSANMVSLMKTGSVYGYASANNFWTLVSSDGNGSFSKWRTNLNTGNNESQIIEYAVNCQEQTIALATFGIQTEKGSNIANYEDKLSYYKPSMVIDTHLVSNVCNKQVAMNDTKQSD